MALENTQGVQLHRFSELSHEIEVKRRSSEDITIHSLNLNNHQISEHSYEQF